LTASSSNLAWETIDQGQAELKGCAAAASTERIATYYIRQY
jgi:hypothetical protein